MRNQKKHLIDVDGQTIELRCIKEVCWKCDGEGKHVNEAIDGNGLSYSDPDLDGDFWDNYWSGLYDVTCTICGGQNVVDALDQIDLESKFPENENPKIWEEANRYFIRLYEPELYY